MYRAERFGNRLSGAARRFNGLSQEWIGKAAEF